jgi:hypothetical protein
MKLKICHLSVFFLMLMVGNSAQAQTSKNPDALYLKNGSVFYGQLKKYDLDGVNFLTTDSLLIILPAANVEKVVMGKPTKAPKNYASKPYAFRERGIYNSLAFTANFGRTQIEPVLGVGVQNTTGFQFNRFIGLGGFVGYENYYVIGGQLSALSLGIETRGYFSKTNLSFYHSTLLGWGTPVEVSENYSFSEKKGGIYVQPALGLRFGGSARLNFFAELGFKWHQMGFKHSPHSDYSSVWDITYRRWVLKAGILF